MAIRVEIKWDNDNELIKYLRKDLPKVVEQSLIEANNETAKDAKKYAKQYVPVDTGSLRKSIRVERLARPKGHFFYTGIRAGGYVRNPKTGRFVDYQRYVEYGTSRQRPQPFMRPAIRKASRNWEGHLWKALSKRVKIGRQLDI